MWNIGQVLRNVNSGDLVVYAGFDDDGMRFFTPEETKGRSDDYTEIEDADGNIDVGDFAACVDLGGCYYGRIDPAKLDDEDWAVIRQICGA